MCGVRAGKREQGNHVYIIVRDNQLDFLGTIGLTGVCVYPSSDYVRKSLFVGFGLTHELSFDSSVPANG